MGMSRFSELFPNVTPIIGMIHLPPLPDYPESQGIDHAIRHAVRDLHVLEQCGVDGVLIENEYDRPHRIIANPATVAAMTRITRAVVQEAAIAIIGCEVLLNDPRASLAIAKMSGANFIRTDYYVDAMTRPGYGEFATDPGGLIEFRRRLDATDVLILADIQVKYATMIAPRSISESARIAGEEQADAIVVTGTATGNAPTTEDLRDAAKGSELPVLIGSGLDAENARSLLLASDGAIVGTALMHDRAVDPAAVISLMSKLDRPKR
jgi:membrane complex biogenesis BtpA family protein